MHAMRSSATLAAELFIILQVPKATLQRVRYVRRPNEPAGNVKRPRETKYELEASRGESHLGVVVCEKVRPPLLIVFSRRWKRQQRRLPFRLTRVLVVEYDWRSSRSLLQQSCVVIGIVIRIQSIPSHTGLHSLQGRNL